MKKPEGAADIFSVKGDSQVNDKRTFVIRRSFVFPMGILLLLTVTLLVVCVLQGQPLAKIVILAILVPVLTALFLESALRRLVMDREGITAFRPLRQRRLVFADVTSLETVRVRNRVFLTLVAGDDDFLIISNSYGDFPALLECLVGAVPGETVTPETRLLLHKPPVRQADVFTVWFAVVALLYVLFAQFKN